MNCPKCGRFMEKLYGEGQYYCEKCDLTVEVDLLTIGICFNCEHLDPNREFPYGTGYTYMDHSDFAILFYCKVLNKWIDPDLRRECQYYTDIEPTDDYKTFKVEGDEEFRG